MKFSLEKTFIVILAVITLFIVAVTLAAVYTKKASPGAGLRKNDPTPESLSVSFKQLHKSAFTRIGQLRTSTAPDENDRRAVVIITPWLEYPGNDAAFYEELDSKLRSIRAIITNYFINYTYPEILKKGELTVKQELTDEINGQLVLGAISAIYFNDYQFLN